MNIRFYMTPGSCSTGIHILLEELELVFEVYLVDLMRGDTRKPEYLAMNPKGTIPTLITADGAVLTDFVSIAWWLGRNNLRAGIIPDTLAGELKVLEVLNYAVNVIHGQGFTRVFTPDNYLLPSGNTEHVIAQGKDLVNRGFRYLESVLSSDGCVVENFSIADAALFYVEFWADRIGMELPSACAQHYQRMLKRSAVQRVLMEEGYGAMFR